MAKHTLTNHLAVKKLVNRLDSSRIHFVFLIFLVSSLSYHAQAAKRCQNSLRHLVVQRLSQIPEVHSSLVRLLNDPKIPSYFKRIIETALLDENTYVTRFQERFRTALGSEGREYLGGYILKQDMKILSTYYAQYLSPTDLLELKKSRPVVFLSSKGLEAEPDLLVLIHELAHIHFHSFLERNKKRLSEILPKKLFSIGENGEIKKNGFYDFLTERYAWQTQYSLLQATEGKQYFEEHDSELKSLFPEPEWDQNARQRLSRHVADLYGIRDPEVLALLDYSVAEILRGIPFRSEPKTNVGVFRRLALENGFPLDIISRSRPESFQYLPMVRSGEMKTFFCSLVVFEWHAMP